MAAPVRLRSIAIDCRWPAGLARFWAAVLGYQVAPYPADELARLAAIGRTPESDPEVCVEPPRPGAGPVLYFNEVPEPKVAKNRVHLEVWLPGDSIDPLVGLGARVLRAPDGDIDWWVVADPEGNEFCAFAAGT